jgi:hypothetical protein
LFLGMAFLIFVVCLTGLFRAIKDQSFFNYETQLNQ